MFRQFASSSVVWLWTAAVLVFQLANSISAEESADPKMSMVIDRLDHLVFTVRDVDATIEFYSTVLGMEVVTFGDQNRKALKFGTSKINLHEYGNEFEPHALEPTPGSADLCFITTTPLNDVIDVLNQNSVPIEEGPVRRTGATGDILSVYVRDPDQNLVEISNYLE